MGKEGIIKHLLVAGIILLLSACSLPLSARTPQDLQRIPQNPQAFVGEHDSDQPLLSALEQQRQAEAYRHRYYLPWQSDGPLSTTQDPFWAIDWMNSHTVFAANLRPLDTDQRQALADLARPQDYPSLHQPATMVRSCSARALPTSSPLFDDPQRPGAGFPFDQLQHAILPANTPVLITHQSADQAWTFVESAAVYGWVPSDAVVSVNEAQAREIEALPLGCLLEDGLGIFDRDNRWCFASRHGALLPLVERSADSATLRIVVADENHRAMLCDATLPASAVASLPLPLTKAHLAQRAATMMGQPYDWGEQFGGRDCSATLRDLFAPFGLWLPRNSSQQAKVGEVLPLSHLSPQQCEQMILEQGIPLATFISLPGHIMLYVGQYEGRAIVLHTLWGLKTTSLFGTEGRWLVGKTVLTTLQPGLEQNNLWQSIGDLRSRITQMSFPLQPAQSEQED
nr:SH3 domain-containing protein [uncultured Desulfuromonas sp.]